MTTPDGPPMVQNHLLAALPIQEYEKIVPHLEKVLFRAGDLLLEQEAQIPFVYFPEEGVVSLVDSLDNKQVEITIIGNEGLIGIPVLLHDNTSRLKAVSQVPGHAFRMNCRVFEETIEQSPSLRRFLERFTLMLLNEISQCLACRQAHSSKQQMVRWLLMCHDRLDKAEFPFTQGFLSDMLCVRRATVTELANQLREAELLDYRRGRIRIINRVGLEEIACECYGRVRREYDMFLGSLPNLRVG